MFLELVDAGSIRRAARRLGIDHSALSRRLARFEDELGVKLVERWARGLRPTPAGQELVSAAQRMQREARAVERRIRNRDAQFEGWVRVSINRPMGLALLVPALVEFHAQYPDIDLDIDLSFEIVDLSANDADVAVRVTREPPGDSIARRVAGFAVATYASREYLARVERDDATHRAQWIGWDRDGPYATFLKDTEYADVPVTGCYRDVQLQFEAARHGLGMAALPCFLGDAEPTLQRLTDAQVVASVFVLRHPDHRSTPRILAFVEYLVGAFGELADLIEGRLPQPSPASE